MGLLSGKHEEFDRILREVVTPHLASEEELVGVCHATEKSSFSYKGWVIGTTPDRLLLVSVDRKWQAKDAPLSITRADITKSSVDGYGAGLKQFVTSDFGDIRFETPDRSFKLQSMGGGMDKVVTGVGQTDGKMAFLEFLASARSSN